MKVRKARGEIVYGNWGEGGGVYRTDQLRSLDLFPGLGWGGGGGGRQGKDPGNEVENGCNFCFTGRWAVSASYSVILHILFGDFLLNPKRTVEERLWWRLWGESMRRGIHLR